MAFEVVEPISLIPGNDNVQSLHSQLLQENILLFCIFMHVPVAVACILIFILHALNKAPSTAFVDG